jgi:hypothetical protein
MKRAFHPHPEALKNVNILTIRYEQKKESLKEYLKIQFEKQFEKQLEKQLDAEHQIYLQALKNMYKKFGNYYALDKLKRLAKDKDEEAIKIESEIDLFDTKSKYIEKKELIEENLKNAKKENHTYRNEFLEKQLNNNYKTYIDKLKIMIKKGNFDALDELEEMEKMENDHKSKSLCDRLFRGCGKKSRRRKRKNMKKSKRKSKSKKRKSKKRRKSRRKRRTKRR